LFSQRDHSLLDFLLRFWSAGSSAGLLGWIGRRPPRLMGPTLFLRSPCTSLGEGRGALAWLVHRQSRRARFTPPPPPPRPCFGNRLNVFPLARQRWKRVSRRVDVGVFYRVPFRLYQPQSRRLFKVRFSVGLRCLFPLFYLDTPSFPFFSWSPLPSDLPSTPPSTSNSFWIADWISRFSGVRTPLLVARIWVFLVVDSLLPPLPQSFRITGVSFDVDPPATMFGAVLFFPLTPPFPRGNV